MFCPKFCLSYILHKHLVSFLASTLSVAVNSGVPNRVVLRLMRFPKRQRHVAAETSFKV